MGQFYLYPSAKRHTAVILCHYDYYSFFSFLFFFDGSANPDRRKGLRKAYNKTNHQAKKNYKKHQENNQEKISSRLVPKNSLYLEPQLEKNAPVVHLYKKQLLYGKTWTNILLQILCTCSPGHTVCVKALSVQV